MADEAELRLTAGALAVEPGIRVGGALMSVVGAALAVEIAFAVAPMGRRLARAVLRPNALHRSPRLDHRPVDAEVLGRQEALYLRVGQYGGQELVRHVACE